MHRRTTGVALLVALALGACGGSDADHSRQVIPRAGSRPNSSCQRFSSAIAGQLGGQAGCGRLAGGRQIGVPMKIEDLAVKGPSPRRAN